MDYLGQDIKGSPKIIELVQYDPDWKKLFEQEAGFLTQVLGKNCVAIHHIGSTAIPGLRSKPVIDILVEVPDFPSLDITAVEQLGFEYRGEVILSGRYFSKKNPKIHLHIFEVGNPLISRYIFFRDWLRTHDDDRKAYEVLKEELALKHKDGVSYARAKTEFVEGILELSRNS
jgi:GrpB-like predicted nucleotidyltransferase (UPF0157 family)